MPHAHVVAAGENTGFHFLEIAMRPVIEKKIHSATRRNIVFRDVIKEEKPILPIPDVYKRQATSSWVVRQFRIPSSPVQALAWPELITTARAAGRSASMALATRTGAAGKRFCVNVPAATAGTSLTRRARSARPSLRNPAHAVAKRKPLGAVDMLQSSQTDRYKTKVCHACIPQSNKTGASIPAKFKGITKDFSSPLTVGGHTHYKTCLLYTSRCV